MSLEICSHCRQLVGCQMPNFFSRIAGLSPRVSTASRKLFAIVSATVSTAGLAMLVPPAPADFQHVAVMRRLQRDLGVLLDQQDRHALLFVNAPDDGENLPYQDWRQPERRLVEQQKRRPVHQGAPDR